MSVYNVEAYVARAIESILAQTLPDQILIIIDLSTKTNEHHRGIVRDHKGSIRVD